MSNYNTVAHLTPGHEYLEIFPDGKVPVTSLLFQKTAFCPEPCYLIDGSLLSDFQVKQLAEHLLRRWPWLFVDREDAELYVRDGFPLLSSYFEGTSTNDPDVLLSALAETFGCKEEDDDLYNYWGSDE